MGVKKRNFGEQPIESIHSKAISCLPRSAVITPCLRGMAENIEQQIEITKAQIKEIEEKLLNKKIFPRLETIENVLNLIPRRLPKNPTNYPQRKNDLEKITHEEDATEEK